MALSSLERQIDDQPPTGVVVAGFGDREFLPALQELSVDGVVLDVALVRWGRAVLVEEDGADIIGFAQADVMQLFMEGVDPSYQRFVESYLEEVINRFGEALTEAADDRDDLAARVEAVRTDLVAGLRTDLGDQRYFQSIKPVIDVVETLPKEDLSALAESLVNLTSLKRRISPDEETVGGPVDVALITKGDGLIWMQRKHYFQPDLNHHFFANYYASREV